MTETTSAEAVQHGLGCPDLIVEGREIARDLQRRSRRRELDRAIARLDHYRSIETNLAQTTAF